MKILLVDDESNVRDVIRYFGKWEQLGIREIIEARNGEEAKMIIVREQPEILITDIKMPKIDGIQLLEWLTEVEYSGKVIILTGHNDYAYMRKAIHYSAYDYLLKPLESEALNATLEGAIQAWNYERDERRDKVSGLYDEVKKERWNRNVTAACEGQPYEWDELIESIPRLEAYDLTLIYFYPTHNPESYIKRLSEKLIELGWGNAFPLQTDRYICVLICATGKTQEIDQWITQLIDKPVRLSRDFRIHHLKELASTFEEARNSSHVKDLRMIHQLSNHDYSRRIQDIISYVNENFTEEMSLDLLARRYFLSREHISRRFKQEKGMTLSDYLTHLRVQQAKKWLHDTEEKMYAISTKLGYQDEKHFSKLFKRIVGMTPMEYRGSKGGLNV